MKRVMIIGGCGSGKSTLARKLHQRLGLELIHLDQHYWNSNWTESDPDTWREKVQELASRDAWIIDGNYGGTMDLRLQRADTIIYLDYPTLKCLWRISKRIWTYHGKVRPDMPQGCEERFNFEFYHYVLTFNMLRRKKLYQLLKNRETDQRVVVLKNNVEVKKYLESVK